MIKRLAAHVGGYRTHAILAPVLVILEVICELMLPRLMAGIVDVGIATGDTGYLFAKGAQMLALALVAMLLGTGAARSAAIAGQGFGGNLRKALFDRVQEFSFADIDRFSSASLITRMTNDVNQIQMLVTIGLRMLTRAPVMLVAALSVTISINARLAMVLLVVIPVMALAVAILMKISTKLFALVQQRIDRINDTVQENLVAIRVVKAFVRERHEREKFLDANNQLTEAGLKTASRIVFMQPIMFLCFNAATIGVLWFGGQQVMGGTMLIGDLSSFLNYIFQILMSVMMVAFALFQLSRSRASAQRVIEVLDTEPSLGDAPDAAHRALPEARGRVEFRGVSFKYKVEGSGENVLSDINLTIEPGAFVAVVGGTGTGKSSLAGLIPRFYDVEEGAVLVDGLDVRDYPLEALRARIGMVLQNNVLFSGTIRENLLWGNERATEEEIIQAAQNAQAYDFIMSFPDGLDTHLEQGGVNVSGGQKQRLCIARAMLRNPAILILDDSTSAVDSATEARIREAFHQNLKDTTIIMIAQRVSSVQYADHIIILDDGRVTDVGTHESLLQSSAIYQEIFASQQEGVRE